MNKKEVRQYRREKVLKSAVFDAATVGEAGTNIDQLEEQKKIKVLCRRFIPNVNQPHINGEIMVAMIKQDLKAVGWDHAEPMLTTCKEQYVDASGKKLRQHACQKRMDKRDTYIVVKMEAHHVGNDYACIPWCKIVQEKLFNFDSCVFLVQFT